VDDDEAVRDAVKERLDSAGFSTATFAELLACIRLAMHQWQPLPAAARDDALAIE